MGGKGLPIKDGLLLWFDGADQRKFSVSSSKLVWAPSLFGASVSSTKLTARNNSTSADTNGITYNATSKGIYFNGCNYLVSNNTPLRGKTSFTTIVYVKGSVKSTYRSTTDIAFLSSDEPNWDSNKFGFVTKRNTAGNLSVMTQTSSSKTTAITSSLTYAEPVNVSIAETVEAGSQVALAVFTDELKEYVTESTDITSPTTNEELLIGSQCPKSQSTSRMPYWGNSEGFTICSVVIYGRALSRNELEQTMQFLHDRYYN